MKKTIELTNADIELLHNYINSEGYCFGKKHMKDNNVKPDTEVSWIIRKNKKQIEEAYNVYIEARTEIEQGFVDDNKTEEKDERIVIKEEFIEEFANHINELYAQKNELEIILIDFAKIISYALDDTDLDIVDFMIDYSKYEEDKEESVEE